LAWNVLYASLRCKSHANPSASLQGQADNLFRRYVEKSICIDKEVELSDKLFRGYYKSNM